MGPRGAEEAVGGVLAGPLGLGVLARAAGRGGDDDDEGGGDGVAAVLAWMPAEVCCDREDSRDCGVVGVVEAVVVLGSMCCGVELIHRARMGRRKDGGRRVMGLRSSSAERRSDLLMVTEDEDEL